ncbi:hypothetical protein HELRODRAFT_178476 [Helobdella robusta]|uniref:Homeobox domain-containing protein n=1 Tax=Helobdella robusta TaxID=6412 RepID=T1FD83_HELRO|nr:hypothetical protein HELRODRAFT_178476 [Helobdella robusta]ESN97033.1 hypothetical protein HELRODRAFT_178476 [Helobdella robusta]
MIGLKNSFVDFKRIKDLCSTAAEHQQLYYSFKSTMKFEAEKLFSHTEASGQNNLLNFSPCVGSLPGRLNSSFESEEEEESSPSGVTELPMIIHQMKSISKSENKSKSRKRLTMSCTDDEEDCATLKSSEEKKLCSNKKRKQDTSNNSRDSEQSEQIIPTHAGDIVSEESISINTESINLMPALTKEEKSSSPNGENLISPETNKKPSDRRTRRVYNDHETEILENAFQNSNGYPVKSVILHICKILDVDEERIRNWFQNRRAKCKKPAKIAPKSPFKLIQISPASIGIMNNVNSIHNPYLLQMPSFMNAPTDFNYAPRIS